MKLRIKGNSLRLRLTRSEVERMAAEGCVEEKTSFGDNALKYVLQRNDEEAISATFTDNTITVFMPAELVKQWQKSDVISFEKELRAGDNKMLSVLVEKDFKCIDNPVEDQSDNYENPNKAC